MRDLAICVVSNRDPPPDFARCLSHMVAYLSGNPCFDNVDLKVAKNCSLLPKARQGMLDECVSQKFSHIMMLDDDMVFPPDIINRLEAHKKRCIGVNSLRKNPNQLHYTARGLDGNWVASKGKTGIERVAAVGLAMFLLDLDVMRKIPKPHFEVRWNEEIQDYSGEDMYFCRKIAGAGEHIFIDHGIANECGHVGQIIYTYDFYDRFKDQVNGDHKDAA